MKSNKWLHDALDQRNTTMMSNNGTTENIALPERRAFATTEGIGASRELLRLHEVEERVRIKRSAIYHSMKHGTPPFPKPIKVAGSSFWIGSEIEAYIDSLMSLRSE